MTTATRGTPRDGLWGCLIGDALGVPYEFKEASEIPKLDLIQMRMPQPGFQKTYPRVPYGTWSDDGSQMLCLLDSLNKFDSRLDTKDFGHQLVAWYKHGHHQAGGHPYDCGLQTLRALECIMSGNATCVASDANSRSAGNGSLMRVLPAALAPALWGVDPAKVPELAMRQSRVTHVDPLAQAVCALYCQVALCVMESGAPESWDGLVLTAASQLHLDGVPERLAAHQTIMAFRRTQMPTGSGYCVDTFWSSIWALDRASDYVSAVQLGISLGRDTDTTAAVIGGLAGLAFGLSSVPPRWWDLLVVPDESRELLDRLVPR